jgi:NhaA family Na+:H+ antiporter
VDTLSFGEQAPDVMMHLRDAGKIAVLMGSICAGVLGSVLINLVSKIDRK